MTRKLFTPHDPSGNLTVMSNLPSATTTEYYNAKVGRVAIFNGENYADFERTCEAVLVITGAWNFVTGREGADARTANTIKCRAEGIKIIFNSVVQSYQAGIRTLMKAQNPRGMWEELTKYN